MWPPQRRCAFARALSSLYFCLPAALLWREDAKPLLWPVQAHAAQALWRTRGPVGGACLMHAGGVLEDGLLATQSAASLRRVFAPKLAGMLNLQRATAAGSPAHWALFSSIASVLGSPGQGNYAAANAGLDAWAVSQQSQVSALFFTDSTLFHTSACSHATLILHRQIWHFHVLLLARLEERDIQRLE